MLKISTFKSIFTLKIQFELSENNYVFIIFDYGNFSDLLLYLLVRNSVTQLRLDCLPDSIADSNASAASSGGKWELT